MASFENIKKVAILGSGPIVIGQACEFDYSGTQACKELMKKGYEVILINSNPATIMTDPELATRTYIEPLKAPYVEKILEKERPDALIPTLGGQTALNLALQLHESGVLQRLGIRMLGASPQTIRAAEDREEFRKILESIGARSPQSEMVRSFDQAMLIGERLGFPLILRPNYTLGGGGGGIAYSLEEYQQKILQALRESPTSEVLVEESILGWKEFELEIMRDRAGTFVVVCSIENFDPCGVHTGDSITVAPQQTLSDQAYQAMRDEARKIVEAVGIETGGANIQFAVHPQTGERVVIEMNPRVSRSSALASKATGFPIAKIAALLAVGYELKDIPNDITKKTPSCYEPALDYIVTKIPRFAFEKFPGERDVLTTQMKSVGEVMAMGRTFKESLQKAVLSLEGDPKGFPSLPFQESDLAYPSSRRLFQIYQAFRDGYSVERMEQLTRISPWFLERVQELANFEKEIASQPLEAILKPAKQNGFSDAAIAALRNTSEESIRSSRHSMKLRPSYLQVDTCAGEFESETPYFYSTYWSDVRQPRPGGEGLVVLGSGPNRIGQGIEFDYSCVRGVKRFRQLGYRVVMINSNPETVSTDYDTSDELFFEPLTNEHVLEVLDFVQPVGFVAQLGGQTPIHLAPGLVQAGHRLLGSSLETVDLAEDRGRFAELCQKLDLFIPRAGMATSIVDAKKVAESVGYPLICRPNYVLGGRRMEIIESESELESYFLRHNVAISKQHPCLMDQFLDRALEVDVDLIRGKDWLVVGGIIEHIEAAGVHSGDSMGVFPPQRLKDETCEKIETLSKKLAEKLNILGFLNLQLAVKDDEVFVLEANPRSSRSIPFIAKASGIPLVDLGAMAIVGKTAKDIHAENYNWRQMDGVSVKGVVFPFKKFPDADSILGPEMKSTGETMGRGADYAEALLKALVGSNVALPQSGEVFLSLREKDKVELLPSVRELLSMGYTLSATSGTSQFLNSHGIPCETVNKVHEGRPHCVDRIRSGEVAFVINTTSGRTSIEASFGIRRSCVDYSLPCLTESDAAHAFIIALKRSRKSEFGVSAVPRSLA